MGEEEETLLWVKKKIPPESYKQVKSEAASLASQHRGRWHTELPGWLLQLSRKLVRRLADWFTDWLAARI